MAPMPAPPCAAHAVNRSGKSPRDSAIDIDALIEENERLRNLVVELSTLVMRNVADRH